MVTYQEQPTCTNCGFPLRENSTESAQNLIDLSKLTWLGVAFAGIWINVIIISLFTPDLVSGSQQEHLRLSLYLSWIWGILASNFALEAHQKGLTQTQLKIYAVVTIVIWSIASLVAHYAPVMVSGSDPTSLPLFSLMAPAVALFLTRSSGIVISNLKFAE